MNNKLEFRCLNADEIDCRIATVKANGITLLLYKDARVDQNILDETVGSMNWQRHHSRDNANCTVSIWDEEKQQWIDKEDTGVESYADKAKGLASDSFKRACFNWGIGRELYNIPFIWVNSGDCDIKPKPDNRSYTCYDKFSVGKIVYDENRKIIALEIKNDTKKKVVYNLGSNHENNSFRRKEAGGEEVKTLSKEQMNRLYNELARTGIGKKNLLANYKVDDLIYLSEEQYKDAISILISNPDKPKNDDVALA